MTQETDAPQPAVERVAKVAWEHRIITRNAGGKTGCRGCQWTSTAHAGTDAAYRGWADHLATEIVRALRGRAAPPHPEGGPPMTHETDLARVIATVTDSWDEPLDEVHDIPQIVNAILAAGWVPPSEQPG